MREAIHGKYGGRCAYCGQEITLKQMHVDHVEPLFRGWVDKPERAGSDDVANLTPACAPCNLWKSTYTVEEFRQQIGLQAARLRKKQGGFRMAERFGQIIETGRPVKFWFER